MPKSILADALQFHDLMWVGGSLLGISWPWLLPVLTPLSSSSHTAGPTLPSKGEHFQSNTPCIDPIDPTKHCCKWSPTAWSVIRMKLRFIEVPLLKSQGYLPEFSGSPFAWQQDCGDPQSSPPYFCSSRLFFLKTRRAKPTETKTLIRG